MAPASSVVKACQAHACMESAGAVPMMAARAKPFESHTPTVPWWRFPLRLCLFTHGFAGSARLCFPFPLQNYASHPSLRNDAFRNYEIFSLIHRRMKKKRTLLIKHNIGWLLTPG